MIEAIRNHLIMTCMFTKLKFCEKRMKKALETFFSIHFTQLIQDNVSFEKLEQLNENIDDKQLKQIDL